MTIGVIVSTLILLVCFIASKIYNSNKLKRSREVSAKTDLINALENYGVFHADKCALKVDHNKFFSPELDKVFIVARPLLRKLFGPDVTIHPPTKILNFVTLAGRSTVSYITVKNKLGVKIYSLEVFEEY